LFTVGCNGGLPWRDDELSVSMKEVECISAPDKLFNITAIKTNIKCKKYGCSQLIYLQLNTLNYINKLITISVI
jgi:hypothetical protein